MTKLKLSFTCLAFALPLIVHADDTPQMGNSMSQPQTGNMDSGSMMTTNQLQMGGTKAGDTNNMSPANNMAPNSMNSMAPSQSGNMMSGSMMTTNQPQMSDMKTNSMNNMAAPQTGNMESHP